MSDLKQTLDAGVCPSFVTEGELMAGSLCTRDALRYRKDCISLESHRILYAGTSLTQRKRERKCWHQFYPTKRKLIYCSRTVPEIEKALAELKRLMEYRTEMGAEDTDFRGLGLTSRRNLCLHPEVRLLFDHPWKRMLMVRSVKKRKAKSSIRGVGISHPHSLVRREGRILVVSHYVVFTRSVLFSLSRQNWYQELNNYEPGNLIPAGVYTLDDVKKYGQEKGVCPYFTIRRMVSPLREQ